MTEASAKSVRPTSDPDATDLASHGALPTGWRRLEVRPSGDTPSGTLTFDNAGRLVEWSRNLTFITIAGTSGGEEAISLRKALGEQFGKPENGSAGPFKMIRDLDASWSSKACDVALEYSVRTLVEGVLSGSLDLSRPSSFAAKADKWLK